MSPAWSNIDVLLKQRHDEIPKLVETCRQYMKFEQDTLEKVMLARSQVSRARQSQDMQELGTAEGALQQAEWKAIRTVARKQVLAIVQAENSTQHLMSRPEHKNHPYILSAVEEEQLIAAKKVKAYLSVTAALAIFIALTILFSIRPAVSL